MIQKRYQTYTDSGLEWSEWFDYEENDSKFSQIKEEKYQLKPKLLNQYRIV